MKMVLIVSLVVFGLMQTSSHADQSIDGFYTVYAEGRAYSQVAEHVVLQNAKLVMRQDAREKCSQAGFLGEPQVNGNTGYCQASYRNRLWTSHCFSEFICS